MKFHIPESDLTMPDSLRGLLSGTLGPVTDIEGTLDMVDGKVVASIGDVVTADLLERGFVPKIGAVDGFTQRGDPITPISEDHFDSVTQIDNPKGSISKDIWPSLTRAYNQEGTTLFKVNGEEDLLSIPALILGPENGFVIYGIPGKGVGVNPINRENKDTCIRIIDSMEAC